MNMRRAEIAVIGGGIVGLACALRLQRAGDAVCLIDDDHQGLATSWRNAGHIATEQVAPLASLAILRSAPRRLFAFGGPLDLRQPWRLGGWIARYLAACAPSRQRAGCDVMRALLADAMPAWREFVDALGAPQLLRETGHIVCWGRADAARRGIEAWRKADIGSAAIVSLDAAMRERLDRMLARPPADAIGFSGTGQISDHGRLRDAARQGLVSLGGELVRGTVTRLSAQSKAAWQVMLDDGERMSFERVVVCAGVRSATLLKPFGWHVPLVAERGYHLHWADHDWPQDLPPVAFEDRSIIATRFDSGLRLAGFVEYAPLEAPADPRKWHTLERHATELGLPVHGTPKRWFGARPTLPDYLPAIGQLRAAPNLYYAFGHQHLGLTLAPVTARMIESLVQGDSKG